MIGKDGAIKGGLDIEETYRLIDLYTQECEKCISVSQVNQLRYTALLDFTARVSKRRHPECHSNEVSEAIEFIQTNINKPLSCKDVVENSNIGRSSLMATFKKETGDTINHFITKAKLEEAKTLLLYSDRTLSQISSLLCFSSQSYFQNLFRKEFFMTPTQFRKKGKQQI